MLGRVAVTGATGFIGWHVCQRLQRAGWSVVAVMRPGSRKPLPDGIEAVQVALEAATLVDACRGADVLVHVAGIVRAESVAAYAAVNVDATRAVADAARAVGARLVHVSSLTAAGPAAVDRPCDESDTPNPITDYGRSKLQGETLVRAVAGLRHTIVRPAAVYGPRDRQFLPLFQAARRGVFLRIPRSESFCLTHIHVEDLARAIEMVCARATLDCETLTIGHPVPVSLDDLLRTLASIFGRAYRPIPVPFVMMRLGAWLGVGGLSEERLREAKSAGFVCRTERAEKALGFRAEIDLPEGFRATAEWYRANGWL
jgi:nucleoside-diphosphate-sugar epimerase